MKAGWELKKFGEVLEIRNGKNQREVESEDGAYPIFGSAGNVMGYASAYICEAGATIIGRKGNINTPVYSETRFWNVDTAFGLVAKSSLDCKFLYYFCLSFDFGALNRGTTIPSLVKSELLEISMPLPPLPEQQRIVAILDEAFYGIATAKANAEKNLQNARALFESHLQAVFTQRGEGWVKTTVGDQLTLQRGFDITKSEQREGDVPVVSSGGIKSFHDTPMVKAPGVVIGRKGTLGKCFYLDQDYWPHDTTLWVKNFKGNEPRFIYYLLLGLDVKHLDSGSANPALNRNQVHPIEISWPPVSKQKVLIHQFDALSEETQRLESLYQRKLAALDELKQSLLHQAFSGQL
ncbi:MAG: restriction endonuclease subunit S [Zoogloea sp.]|nr:restriction endonuclease subunit S [Zoogloea sp.]